MEWRYSLLASSVQVWSSGLSTH